MANTKVSSEQIIDDVALAGNPTATTQGASDNSTKVATTAYVTTAVSNLVDSAPSSLNTLNELAAAMNDNASFFSTVLPLSGGTMTGDLVLKSDGGDDVINVVHSGNTVKLVSIGQSSDNSGNGVIQLRRNNGVVHSQIHSHGSTYFNGGSVGVGFASGTPDELLHLQQASGTTIVKTEVAANSVVGFEIQKTGATTSNWRIVDGQTVNGSLEIYDVTDSRQVMVFDGDGDIGMGVTPATHAKLTLGGTTTSYSSVLAFDNNTTGGATFFMLASDNTWSAGGNKFLMGHGSPSSSAVDMSIDSDGNLTVGSPLYGSSLGQVRITKDAASAPASLSLFGYNNLSDGDEFAKIDFASQISGTGGNPTAKISAKIVGTNERAADLTFHTHDDGGSLTQRMVIDSGGNLGVGISSSLDGQLHVRGTTNKTIKIDPTFSSGTFTSLAFARNGTDKWRVFQNSTDDYLSFYNDATSTHQLYLKSDNKVGIGTTSIDTTARLQVDGGIRFNHFSAGHGLNVVSYQSFNNTNVANACGTVYYKCFIVNIYHNNGHTNFFGISNGGGGVGFNFTILRPDTSSQEHGQGISFSTTTIGSSPNSFNFVISSGGGALTIERTSGTGSFAVSVQNIAGG